MGQPMVVIERVSGEVYLFSSLEDAEQYIEPIDVERQEYEAYDANGKPMLMELVGPQETPSVRLTAIPNAAPQAEEVKGRLRTYFMQDRRWKADYDGAELSQIVRALLVGNARL